MARSLKDFAAAESKRNRCFFCNLPETSEINAGKASGITMASIRRWLVVEKGYDPKEVAEERLRKHYRSGHGNLKALT